MTWRILRIARGIGHHQASMVSVDSALTLSILHADRASRLIDVRCHAEKGARPFEERHDRWVLALVRRGAFNYRAADTNQTYALRPGWLILGRLGVDYECSHDHEGGDDCLALEIAPELVDEVASATRGCRGAVFPVPVLGPVTHLALQLERLSANRDDFDEGVYGITSGLLAYAHNAAIVSMPAHRAHRTRIDAAVAQIERSCAGPLPLADLAAQVGLSPFHFLRAFRKVTGSTPHQYIIGARIRRAARLLLDTTRSVTEIAYDVGFEDLSNFVRTFHRAAGCAPGAFRKGPPRCPNIERIEPRSGGLLPARRGRTK